MSNRLEMPPKPMMRKAFSLVELSIVLVILGLLVGGVLSGQSLIRAAQLRSIPTEQQRYLSAMNSFRDKYLSLPGDMSNATSFWAFMGGTGCTNRTSASTNSSGACDGDGDGVITFGISAGQPSEAYQVWRQLALSGLIEGSYSGVAGSMSFSDPDFGVNTPRSRISNVGWDSSRFDNRTLSDPNVYQENYANWFSIGTRDESHFADGPFLKTEEAWNIDTKIDDGLPGQGSVNTWPPCSTINSQTNRSGLYLLNDNQIRCMLLFKHS